MTLSLKLSAPTTDTNLPRSERDKFIRAGVLACFDFLNSYCNPNSDGILPDGAVFKDLVYGGADASFVAGSGSGIGVTQLAGRAGIRFPGSSLAQAGRIRLGTSRSFYPSKSFTIGIWFRQAADSTAPIYIPIAQRTPNNANGCEWIIDSGSAGQNFRGQIGVGGTLSNGPVTPGLLSLGNVHQVAFSYVPSQEIRLFHDGAQIAASVTNSTPASLQDARSSPIDLSVPVKGDLFRFWMEDNAVSGRTAAQAVAADYEQNSARFI